MTAIPYLDEMWSITTGCGDDMVSPGCHNCYARRMTKRNLWKCPDCGGKGERITLLGDGVDCPDCDGTGTQDFTPTFHADRLEQPLHWRKPRVVGVSFMGDLFHEAITDGQVDRVFEVIHMCRQHTFMLLTKRPERMSQMLSFGTPLPNLWPGATVCNQEEADRNIPIVLATPAAKRWVSLEPMLGPADLSRWGRHHYHIGLQLSHAHEPMENHEGVRWSSGPYLDWVVLGGETGPGARPMQPEWALDVYGQCKAAGVPFWFKSMGTDPHKKVWDWPNTEGAEMQNTHELPAALAEAVRA